VKGPVGLRFEVGGATRRGDGKRVASTDQQPNWATGIEGDIGHRENTIEQQSGTISTVAAPVNVVRSRIQVRDCP
jgi:hypothetical protein